MLSRSVDSYLVVEQLRRTVVEKLHAAGGGHYGGCLSVLDILYVATRELGLNNRACQDPEQENFLVLSKGHAAMALYVLAEAQKDLQIDLSRFGRIDGPSGHPDMAENKWVCFSTGSLGQGLSAALGAAFILRQTGRQAWAILGDGECQEGQVWEAAMLATRYKVGNVNAIIDLNGQQECGWSDSCGVDNTPLPAAAAKWQAFGWDVHVINGHDHAAIADTMRKCWLQKSVPSVIIARTNKGNGAPFFIENLERSHCTSLTEEEFSLAMKGIHGSYR